MINKLNALLCSFEQKFVIFAPMNFGFYGTTWWGKKWLESLLSTADPKVIATGLRYAQKGQLTKLDILDNRVMTEVLGPAGGTHNNYLVFPKFEKEKGDLFVNLLKQQPSDLLALSNGAMNPSIELLLTKSGLDLFDSIEKINLNCDCKDPLPCKYIVASLLKIAETIDSNPFALFRLHGLDIEYLKDYKPEQTEIEVPKEAALVRSRIAVTESNLNIPFRTPELDYEHWNDYSRILPAMLQNFPKFCPSGNFRKSFADELERCRQYYLQFKDFDEFADNYKVYNASTFFVEGDCIWVIHKKNWNWTFVQGDKNRKISQSGLAPKNVMGALCNLSAGNFSWHDASVRYFQRLMMAAFYFIRTGAIYPQVFWIGPDTAQMRWLPAEMLPDVLATVADLEKSAPRNIVQTVREEEFLEVLEPAEHILSLFIVQLIAFFRKFNPSTKRSPHENLLSFFFDCKSGKLANNAQSIPSKIQQWFSVYSSLDFKTPLLFSCSEAGDEIALEIFVMENGGRTPLSTLFENNDARLLSVVSILNGIAESFKPMNAYIEQKAASPILMHGGDLLDFLQDSMKKLEIFGIQTELPQSLLHVEKPKVLMRLQGSIGFGAFNAEDLLDFDWEVALGDHKIPAEEFLQLAEQAEGMLKYKSTFIQVSPQDIEDLRKKLEGKSGPENPDPGDLLSGTSVNDSANTENKDENQSGEQELDPSIAKQQVSREAMVLQAKLIQACLTGQCDNVAVELNDDVKKQVEEWRGDSEVDLPQGLNATLRPYQHRGYSWMYKNLQMGFGCILADDMGMGKTLQVISFLLKMKQENKFENSKALVVLPAGLLVNWQMEIKKFAQELTFFAYHGGSRNLQKFSADLLLTTYATFRKDYKLLKELSWQAIIIDEAQNIKNADSEQSKLLRSMDAPMKIAMSGTPVENRLMEFWTIMDFANRGLFPSAQEFREKFEVPIQKNNDQRQVEVFKTITAPFMLRRLKTDKDIISDLPEKIIQDEYAELTRTQAALYQSTLQKFMEQLEEEKMLSEAAHDSHALFKRKGIILQMILALKQICNHPRTFLKGAVSENDNEALSANTEKTSPKSNRLESGKIEMLMALLESIQETGEKTLIFTQFAEMGHLLKTSIEERLGLQTHFYHGGCTQTQRTTIIKEFQDNPDCKVLILSLKAGGTGLNLTAASQVIHYDLWWNPAIEAQATDRAFRIGQKRNVQVHRFITKGTFEEKINALLETKKAIANLTVNAGETWLADMNDKQLSEIFSLDNSLL